MLDKYIKTSDNFNMPKFLLVGRIKPTIEFNKMLELASITQIMYEL